MEASPDRTLAGTTENKSYGFMTDSQDFSAYFLGEADEEPGSDLKIPPGPYGNVASFEPLAPETNSDNTSNYSDGSSLEIKQDYYGTSGEDNLTAYGFQPGDFGIGVSDNGPAYTSVHTGFEPSSTHGDNLLLDGFFSGTPSYTAPLAHLQMSKV